MGLWAKVVLQVRQKQMNQQNTNNDIALRGSIGAWWGSLLTAVILTVAVKNLWINTQTLELTKENMENTKRSASNTAEMLSQLKQINQKL